MMLQMMKKEFQLNFIGLYLDIYFGSTHLRVEHV